MAPIFDPKVLHQVARASLPLPIAEKVKFIHAELSQRYPGRIVERPEWVFNVAGGAMGQLCLLHASLGEYVIIFGSPLGSDGHTGRFRATDWFTILDGEQQAFEEGALVAEIYRPGDQHVMPAGVAKGYRTLPNTWALEYARGNIPSMLPFGLADSVTSTLDLKSVAKTFRMYGQATVKNMLLDLRGGRAPAPAPAPARARAGAPSPAHPARSGAPS